MAAVAAIEIACWDIVGKAAGQPIHALLGGKVRDRVRVYANGWYRTDRRPEAVAAEARKVAARGYTAMKFDPFGSAWRVQDRRDEDLSIDIVRAVRDAVGPDVDLMIEAHNRFTASTALRLADRLAEFHPAWLEEPVHHSQMGSMVEVARRSPVPIATGESFTSLGQFADLLSHDVVQILQPEPLHLGGLWRTRQVASLAEAHLAVVAPAQRARPGLRRDGRPAGRVHPELLRAGDLRRVQRRLDAVARRQAGPPGRRVRRRSPTRPASASSSTGTRSKVIRTTASTSSACSARAGSGGTTPRPSRRERRGRTARRRSTPFEPDQLVDALVAVEPTAAGRRGDVRVVRAPGRVNLIGEHTDYNDGLRAAGGHRPRDPDRLPAERRRPRRADPTRRRVARRLRPRRPGANETARGWTTSRAPPGRSRRPARRSPACAAWSPPPCRRTPACRRRPRSSSPRPGRCSTTWPRTSIRSTLARLCQRAENAYVGVQCGLMDQFAAACGVAGSAVLLDCRSLEWRAVPLPDDVRLVVLPHRFDATARRLRVQPPAQPVRGGGRRDRPRRPGGHSPPRRHPVPPGRRAHRASTRSPTDEREHVVTENQRVMETIGALGAGRPRRGGRAVRRQPRVAARPVRGQSRPSSTRWSRSRSSVPGVVAARMTGAGFGGCTVNLVRPEAIEALRTAVEREYPARTGLHPDGPAGGRGRRRRPAALSGCARHATGARAHASRTSVPGAEWRVAASLTGPQPGPRSRDRSRGTPANPPEFARLDCRSPRRRPPRPDTQDQPDHGRLDRDHHLAVPGRDRGHRGDRRWSASTTRLASGLPDASGLTTITPVEETIIYDRTGKIELARFGDERREVVTFEEIPPVLLDATTAVEDKTFWDNAGLRPGGDHLGRARLAPRQQPRRLDDHPAARPRASPADPTSSRTRTGRSSASSRRSSSRSG